METQNLDAHADTEASHTGNRGSQCVCGAADGATEHILTLQDFTNLREKDALVISVFQPLLWGTANKLAVGRYGTRSTRCQASPS